MSRPSLARSYPSSARSSSFSGVRGTGNFYPHRRATLRPRQTTVARGARGLRIRTTDSAGAFATNSESPCQYRPRVLREAPRLGVEQHEFIRPTQRRVRARRTVDSMRTASACERCVTRHTEGASSPFVTSSSRAYLSLAARAKLACGGGLLQARSTRIGAAGQILLAPLLAPLLAHMLSGGGQREPVEFLKI